MARVLSRDYAVVQAAVTEPAIPGTIVRRGLSVRQYLALIAVADAFVGGTTGGSHAAAAFGVPSFGAECVAGLATYAGAPARRSA